MIILKLLRSVLFRFFVLPSLLVGSLCHISYASNLFDQREVFSSEQSEADYIYTLGSLETINAVLTAERELRLTGAVTRKTYEFDRDLSRKEAWASVRQHFNLASANEYFSCSGLDCGSSNAWANDRFGIKQLYGLDATQRYLAFSPKENDTAFIALYFVQRGNKRMYLQVDTIKVTTQVPKIAASASVILDALQREKWFVLYLTKGELDEEELKQLSDALRKKPMLKFYIVGHSYTAKGVDATTILGLEHAQKLQQKLVQAGVKESRMEVHSVGNLVPRYLSSHAEYMQAKDRVEIVIR